MTSYFCQTDLSACAFASTMRLAAMIMLGATTFCIFKNTNLYYYFQTLLTNNGGEILADEKNGF
jgi:hypothetical protein